MQSLNNFKKKYKAFSLIEIVMVLALFATLAVVSLPIGLTQLKKDTTHSQASNLLSTIFVMQQNAYNGKSSGEFGIYFTANGYYIYEGVDYNNSSWSEYTDLEGATNVSVISFDNSSNEMHFTKGELLPNTFGNVIINNSNINYSVEVNKEGVLDIERL